MTAIRLTCPCGHTWEHAQAATVPADLRRICPVCTPAAAAAPEAGMPRTVHQSAEQRAALGPAAAAHRSVIAGFELLEELDRGGMGVVYKARQTALNRLVAVKMIAPRALLVPGARTLFEREVRAAARLNHPNIVTAFHTVLDGPTPYLAMEYVPGIDLRRLVAESGPLPAADAIYYIREAAEGLQHAHEQGLVHRDVKPSNLMVAPAPGTGATGRPPRVKLLDLGLARVVTPVGHDPADARAVPGGFMGTPDYVAPEQAADPDRADARSDLFSLGGTLYFLLTGAAPFPGDTLADKLRAMAAGPPVPASARRPGVPAALDAVVQKLLAHDPADRFQSAAEVVAALDHLPHARAAGPPGAHVSPPAGPAAHDTDRTILSDRTHGALMSDNLFDRQRSALARLTDAARGRRRGSGTQRRVHD